MDRTAVSNRPVETLRDGSLKAPVWRNEGEKGPYYTVSLSKIYEDQKGQVRETNSFTASELLRVAELAREAHCVVRDLRREHSKSRNAEVSVEQTREDRPGRFR